MQRVAHGRLGFERAGSNTVVRDAYAESPLRFLTPRNHGEAAWAYTSTLGGGFVDGDRVRLRISVAEGARAFVSTQGPTRVYRSARGCESEIAARVGSGGVLVLAPDPTACFAGARFRQRIELDLIDGASVALCDVLSAGRSARGERWALDTCLLALTVRRDSRTVLDESWLLDRAQGALPARLGRFEALATVLLIGPVFANVADRWRAELDMQPPVAGSPVVESGSPLEDGAVLRLAGTSVDGLTRTLRARLAALPALLGDDPWARRA